MHIQELASAKFLQVSCCLPSASPGSDFYACQHAIVDSQRLTEMQQPFFIVFIAFEFSSCLKFQVLYGGKKLKKTQCSCRIFEINISNPKEMQQPSEHFVCGSAGCRELLVSPQHHRVLNTD